MIAWYWTVAIAVVVLFIGFYAAWVVLWGRLLKSFFEGWKR